MRLDKIDVFNPHFERAVFLTFTRRACADRKSQSYRWMYQYLVSCFVRADNELSVSFFKKSVNVPLPGRLGYPVKCVRDWLSDGITHE